MKIYIKNTRKKFYSTRMETAAAGRVKDECISYSELYAYACDNVKRATDL